MLYRDLRGSAEDLLRGSSHYRALLGELDRSNQSSQDELYANASDADLHRMAKDMADSFGLPRERSVNIENHLRTQRQMSQERLEWCRHIEMFSKTAHEKSPVTMYREPPEYACHCRLFADRLIRADDTWLKALEDFKLRHCAACDRREPLTGQPD
jgi:hypothetical protein